MSDLTANEIQDIRKSFLETLRSLPMSGKRHLLSMESTEELKLLLQECTEQDANTRKVIDGLLKPLTGIFAFGIV